MADEALFYVRQAWALSRWAAGVVVVGCRLPGTPPRPEKILGAQNMIAG